MASFFNTAENFFSAALSSPIYSVLLIGVPVFGIISSMILGLVGLGRRRRGRRR